MAANPILRRRFLIVAACFGISFSAQAETIEPRAGAVQYEFFKKEDQVGRVCNLQLTINNFPGNPELVKVTFLAALKKSGGSISDGFTVDAGDVLIQDGKPTGVMPVPLSSAAFYSPTFNSAGRLYPADMGDGGIGAFTSDFNATLDLWIAVGQGNYTVEFTRRGTPTARSYHITTGPTVEEFRQFSTCVQSMDVIQP